MRRTQSFEATTEIPTDVQVGPSWVGDITVVVDPKATTVEVQLAGESEPVQAAKVSYLGDRLTVTAPTQSGGVSGGTTVIAGGSIHVVQRVHDVPRGASVVGMIIGDDGRVITGGGQVLTAQPVALTITVPAAGVVSLTGTEGDIHIEGQAEQVTIDQMTGAVSMTHAATHTNISVQSGRIDIDTVAASASAKASSMGGDIRLGDVQGYVNASTMSGHVAVDKIAPIRSVKLSTMSGNVTYALAPGARRDLIKADTMSGHIRETQHS